MPLKTKYQYIHFVELPEADGQKAWSCRNTRHGDELGQVVWYAPWNQFTYIPSCGAVYSTGCLKDIQDFIGQLTKDKTG